jgi:thiosulfate dehydrogenase
MGRAVLIIAFAVVAGCGKESEQTYAIVPAIPGSLADSAFPNTPIGNAARRGRAILTATRDSLPGYVGNGLRCTSCHLDDGRRPNAMPWLGVHARYPQYRSRAARVLTVEDRINECLERSLGGRPLLPGDERLRAIEAYFAFISAGIPTGASTPGQGIDSVGATKPDTNAGQFVFAEKCSRCHGTDGAGTALATPVWGERAYTIAAGMARYRMAAGFIHRNMPYDAPGTLTEQQALDVAAYIDSRPRRDHAGKELDWPNGGAPPDIPYRTTATAASKSPAK